MLSTIDSTPEPLPCNGIFWISRSSSGHSPTGQIPLANFSQLSGHLSALKPPYVNHSPVMASSRFLGLALATNPSSQLLSINQTSFCATSPSKGPLRPYQLLITNAQEKRPYLNPGEQTHLSPDHISTKETISQPRTQPPPTHPPSSVLFFLMVPHI